MESTYRASAGEVRRYATFFVADRLFGIDVLSVQEVLRPQEMTRVPLAPALVRGLINLRGQIVTALDLRERLQLPPRAEENQALNVVVRSEEGVVSLLVDEISDVIEVTQDTFEDAPQALPQGQRELIDGVYKLENRLLLALNMERVLQ